MHGSAERSDRVLLKYPRRNLARQILRQVARVAVFAVCRLEITGRENIPEDGPLIMAGNHFHFVDPVLILLLSRRQVEFVGGFRFPNAPMIVKFIPKLWGYLPAFRGGYSRSTLDYSSQVLAQDGVLAIFPEGGSWAKVLRPPRPGAAFLAFETVTPVVPVGIDGAVNIFKQIRPIVQVRIGKPIVPATKTAVGVVKRKEIDRFGNEIMREIAALLPEERRGAYSENSKLRKEAEKVSDFPFEERHMRGM